VQELVSPDNVDYDEIAIHYFINTIFTFSY